MRYSLVCVTCFALIAVAAVGGCAEFPHVDHVFGSAYANLIHRQTFNLHAAAAHHGAAPGGGMRLEKVLKAHHGAVSSAVARSVKTGQFQTGGGGG